MFWGFLGVRVVREGGWGGNGSGREIGTRIAGGVWIAGSGGIDSGRDG